jgi:hypothetical protein
MDTWLRRRGVGSPVYSLVILLYSLVPRNIVTYIYRCYIPRLLSQLTVEYTLYSSVIELCSSTITEEHILVSRRASNHP